MKRNEPSQKSFQPISIKIGGASSEHPVADYLKIVTDAFVEMENTKVSLRHSNVSREKAKLP